MNILCLLFHDWDKEIETHTLHVPAYTVPLGKYIINYSPSTEKKKRILRTCQRCGKRQIKSLNNRWWDNWPHTTTEFKLKSYSINIK